MVVKDNDIGFPNDVEMGTTETLGLQLVHDLANQIEGSYEIQGNDGTTFKIVF